MPKNIGVSAVISSDVNKIYGNARTFAEMTTEELQEKVPELRGLTPAENQQELRTLLGEIGDRTGVLFHKLPNLICNEEVFQKQNGHKQERLKFEYLILSHKTPDSVVLEEYRVDLHSAVPVSGDSKNRAKSTTTGLALDREYLRRKSNEVSTRATGAPPLSQGFAYKWVHLYPANWFESKFRYLGRQTVDGKKTLVLAFAQKPESVRQPGELRFRGQVIPLLYQGIAWIDESDFRILRLRTDLLAPLKEIHLERLTAEVQFSEAHVAQSSSSLWLPKQVAVITDISGHTFEDRHVYSNYRVYTVESKILLIQN